MINNYVRYGIAPDNLCTGDFDPQPNPGYLATSGSLKLTQNLASGTGMDISYTLAGSGGTAERFYLPLRRPSTNPAARVIEAKFKINSSTGGFGVAIIDSGQSGAFFLEFSNYTTLAAGKFGTSSYANTDFASVNVGASIGQIVGVRLDDNTPTLGRYTYYYTIDNGATWIQPNSGWYITKSSNGISDASNRTTTVCVTARPGNTNLTGTLLSFKINNTYPSWT